MSLQKLLRNGRLAKNYDLAAQVPRDGETLAEIVARGLAEKAKREESMPDDGPVTAGG